MIICPRCERELTQNHHCFTRRSFFFGILGASGAALAARLNGVPLPYKGPWIEYGQGIHIPGALSGQEFTFYYDGRHKRNPMSHYNHGYTTARPAPKTGASMKGKWSFFERDFVVRHGNYKHGLYLEKIDPSVDYEIVQATPAHGKS